MSIVDHSYRDTTVTPGYSKRLMGVGIAFAIIGAVAIVLPAWATLAGELIVAWLLVLWAYWGSGSPGKCAQHGNGVTQLWPLASP